MADKATLTVSCPTQIMGLLVGLQWGPRADRHRFLCLQTCLPTDGWSSSSQTLRAKPPQGRRCGPSGSLTGPTRGSGRRQQPALGSTRGSRTSGQLCLPPEAHRKECAGAVGVNCLHAFRGRTPVVPRAVISVVRMLTALSLVSATHCTHNFVPLHAMALASAKARLSLACSTRSWTPLCATSDCEARARISPAQPA